MRLLTRPFFGRDLNWHRRSRLQLDLGRLNLGDARLKSGFLVVEADHGGHAVGEIHHQETNDDDDDRNIDD